MAPFLSRKLPVLQLKAADFLFKILDVWEKLTLRQCAIAINSKVSIKDEHKSSWKPQIRANWIQNNVEYSEVGNFSQPIFGSNLKRVEFHHWYRIFSKRPMCFLFSELNTMILYSLHVGGLFNVTVHVDGPTFKCLSQKYWKQFNKQDGNESKRYSDSKPILKCWTSWNVSDIVPI